ncbi:hypothetical protein [Actinomadura sp. 6N118]|uniref:hypothetical protein n=1 Tax=Actinomadura sp. 6N118 TaxID=3375151 RepID=UPI00378A0619
MRLRALLLVTAATITTALPAAVPAGAGTTPPDPAPGGPQRPYEPDVNGPQNLDTLSVSVTRHAGRSVTVGFDRRSRTASGVMPAAPRRFVFLFDRSLTFHPEAFPTCARSVIETSGPDACPAGSRIGGGIGTAYDGRESPVLAFNTWVGALRGLLVVLPESGVVLEQTFERVSGPYRDRYRWALDEIVPPTPAPPEQRAGTSRFRLSFGATTRDRGRPVGFVETTRGGKLGFGLWSEFVTGQVVLPEWQTLTP